MKVTFFGINKLLHLIEAKHSAFNVVKFEFGDIFREIEAVSEKATR